MERSSCPESSDKEKTCKLPDGNIITVGCKKADKSDLLAEADTSFVKAELANLPDFAKVEAELANRATTAFVEAELEKKADNA